MAEVVVVVEELTPKAAAMLSETVVDKALSTLVPRSVTVLIG